MPLRREEDESGAAAADPFFNFFREGVVDGEEKFAESGERGCFSLSMTRKTRVGPEILVSGEEKRRRDN